MRIYKLSEMTDARIMYDKRPPRFFMWIIYVVLIALVAFVLWGSFSYKSNVINAQGVVSTVDKTYIMNTAQGMVTKSNFKEGDIVTKGDIIIEIDDSQPQSQIAAIKLQLAYFSEQINYINKFISTLQNFNYVNLGENVNPFINSGSSAQYALQFNSIMDAIKKVEKTKPSADDPTLTVDKTQEELTVEYKQTVEMYLSQMYQQQGQYDYEYLAKRAELSVYEKNLANYKVVAQSDGIIHFSSPCNPGIVLQAGGLIGNISQGLTADNALIESYIPSIERSFITLGQSVQVAVDGILQSDYGVLKGKIVEIDSDITVNQDNGGAFYKVKIKPNKVVLSKKDKTLSVKNGMTVKATIVYEELTWIKWIGKQIGVVK